ncbi:MAG: hypothetical protein RLZ08_633 [Pseudomonadota bacterium]|jgi:hypothetical protein|nr:hypothetical protein [Candidatus Fonsibacter lacus]
MTFTHLSLLLIIFFLIFPAKIKEPTNIQYYSEDDLKLRSKVVKIYYYLNLLVIGFYVAAFVLVSFYPHLFKRVV